LGEIALINRKLTTILSADVVGYTRLMEENEERTHLNVLAFSEDVLQPAIAKHRGRVVKKTGDGVLAEFESVVQAALCAIAIQNEGSLRNKDYPASQRISYRIGINIGDVFVEPDDIYGDGVNIAVRLEGLASPGGIVVSRAVRDSVSNKLQLRFVDMGEIKVKNISRPIHAFMIETSEAPSWSKLIPRIGRTRLASFFGAGLGVLVIGGFAGQDYVKLAATQITTLLNPASESAGRISILVLPFRNLSSDASQEYFVDGVTDSLITDLSRALPGAFVVSRGTAFSYKKQPMEAVQIGRDLNVQYLLEGSVTPEPQRIRVNARLVEAGTGRELWGDRFDARREDVLEVQDQIVARLSRAIGLSLVDIESRRLSRGRPHEPSAIDLVMRAQSTANKPASPANMIVARALFERALAVDSDNADALAGVAATYVFEVLNSYYHDGRQKRLSDAETLIRKALDIDPDHVTALKTRAAIMRANGKFEDAIAASRAVIARNPGEPWAYKEVGLSELYLGRFEEARTWFDKADRIGPRDPSRWIWLGALGRVEFILGNTSEALRLLKLSAEANPKDARAYALLAAIYALSGRREESSWALANAVRLQPEITINSLFNDWSVPLEATSNLYRQQHERFRSGLQLAGMRD
jgi:TolB-like protein/class 3 adenylate cyclase/Flp pilus assembly protein TadD